MTRSTVILRAAERVQVPWKNGGGTTCVLATHPPSASADAWDWRVSMAEVATPGPFSYFEAVDRTLLLLSGTLDLAIGEGAGGERLQAGDVVRFAGDVPTFGTPVDGWATDLNIMVRRGQWRVAVERFGPSEAPQQLLLFGESSLLFFADGGRMDDADLSAHDGVLLRGGQGEAVHVETRGSLYLVSFLPMDQSASA